GWLRCSSLKYSRYSRSSRLAIRAPRSAIWSSFSRYRPLGEDVVDDRAALRASQPHIQTLILHGELCRVHAQQVQHRRVEVVHADRIFDGRVAEIVGGAVGEALPDAGAGEH